jgi:hypothetical protein
MAKWGQTVEPEKKSMREPVRKEVVEMAQPTSTNHIIIEAGDFE